MPKVEVKMGKFVLRDCYCQVKECSAECERVYTVPIEKKTDVAIGATMVRDAYLDLYDVCVLVSGDSDFTPAAKMVKEKQKRLEIKVPSLGRDVDAIRGKTHEFKQIADEIGLLPVALLIQSQLPQVWESLNGRKHHRPGGWRQAPPSAYREYLATIPDNQSADV